MYASRVRSRYPVRNPASGSRSDSVNIGWTVARAVQGGSSSSQSLIQNPVPARHGQPCPSPRTAGRNGRVYLPHRQLKWQRHLISGLAVVPDRLTGRLEAMTASPPAKAFPAAQILLEDTVLLAEARTGADLSAFRRALAERRHPLDPPSPGQ
jgi:hypothetical protein